ncbi:hypothetical protein ABEB36_010958 [Hypothenemus hampei]|uniref:TRASH domain-containing protein n=2 Tax=Hypothenemus hampei TaxID=57062 RepID=A0ABD1EDN5_HYPHA
MEIDGIDGPVKKSAVSSSNDDCEEKESVTKAVLNSDEKKEAEIQSNDLNNSENSRDETLWQPNGEPELTDNVLPPERSKIEDPLTKENIESHLESNINVIENQNNENLERDNELMENEEPPETNKEPIEVNSTSKSDSDPSESTDPLETLKPNTMNELDNVTSTSDSSDLPQTVTEENSSNDDELNVKTDNSKEPNESEEFPETKNLNESETSIVKDTEFKEKENESLEIENLDQSDTNIVKEALSSEPSSNEKLEPELSDDQNESKQESDDSPKKSPIPKVNETQKELDSELIEEKLNKEPEEENEDTTESLPTELQDIEKSISSTVDLETPKDIEKETSVTETPDSVEEQEIDNIEVQREDESKEKIVNNEDPPTPICHDDLPNIDTSKGADEEVIIIPDSQREISEEEKEAASSLPTLKDISDKTQIAASITQEIEHPENEIKMYKYEKGIEQECCQCKTTKQVKYHFFNKDQEITYICEDGCLNTFKTNTTEKVSIVIDELRVKNFTEGSPKEKATFTLIRTCASCHKVTDNIANNLTWEILDFCNEFCLSKYQKQIGSKCTICLGDVKSIALGKYCVRFGNDIRQFCCSSCLEQYKKGLKVCSYCQQDMSNTTEGFLAPVGEKGQFKDFCSKVCMEKYDIMTNDRPPKVKPGTTCSVCKAEKPITIEYEHEQRLNYFCGEPCLVAFAFVNKTSTGKCAMCLRHFPKSVLEQHTMFYDNVQHSFCSHSCKNIYIIAHRKIVPCSWCKVKKYNFDMIKKYSKNSPVINMCSLYCFNLYRVSLTVVNAKAMPCNFCKKHANPAYHLAMSDASMRHFCSYSCVMNFQNQFPKQIALNHLIEPVPTGIPVKTKRVTAPEISKPDIAPLPIISNVQSLATTNGTSSTQLPTISPVSSTKTPRLKTTASTTVQDHPVQVQIKQHYIVKEKPIVEQRNVAVMCQPRKIAKGSQAAVAMKDACIQTDKEDVTRILIPVPMPVYVPSPCHMFTAPVPIPVPFPLPIPVPIFIPTTRNSAAGIMKEIKKIQVKIPTDPYEAELLMMAEMVAEEKKEDHTDSESDLDEHGGDGEGYSPEAVDTNNTFGDDVLQMALKMATELDEPAVDLEGALTANTITAPQGGHPPEGHPPEESVDEAQPIHPHLMERSPLRGRKRGMRGTPRTSQSKRGRRMSHHQVDMPMMQPVQPPAPEPQEKPDANMCLKYTFGVNAWKQWVTTKNVELEKSTRRVKLFKTEILQLTADELNYSLCLFVKEVRKPNGQEYAPDTIYYLCLGIQQYLFENGRIDNIFCDSYYEKFTDCLDEVAKKFSVLYNDSHYIVTRVEEEHLWESKQLGAHSPHVLLSTLMFFNTKHFNLTTVDEHMQLSFSHIMKHWKRNPNQPGASKVPGSRNVLLRFYPPQSALQNNQRKKKVYEQQENEENPLRCPVKLYEFYLSKCPESVKTRNDVFYLQPERSCVPDSPVWYSTMHLPKEALEKMLHRVKMVKEINVALLTS